MYTYDLSNSRGIFVLFEFVNGGVGSQQSQDSGIQNENSVVTTRTRMLFDKDLYMFDKITNVMGDRDRNTIAIGS